MDIELIKDVSSHTASIVNMERRLGKVEGKVDAIDTTTTKIHTKLDDFFKRDISYKTNAKQKMSDHEIRLTKAEMNQKWTNRIFVGGTLGGLAVFGKKLLLAIGLL